MKCIRYQANETEIIMPLYQYFIWYSMSLHLFSHATQSNSVFTIRQREIDGKLHIKYKYKEKSSLQWENELVNQSKVNISPSYLSIYKQVRYAEQEEQLMRWKNRKKRLGDCGEKIIKGQCVVNAATNHM